MNSVIIVNIFRFAGLMLMQVLVISNLKLGYYANPYIYHLFLLTLPFQIPQWILIVIAFSTGITMDAFSNTMGMHAAACAFMVFARPVVLRILTPKSSYETLDQPRLQSLGYLWFLLFTGVLTLFHHLVYFFLEVFSMDNFFITLGKVLFSTIVSTLLIMLISMIFSSGKKRV